MRPGPPSTTALRFAFGLGTLLILVLGLMQLTDAKTRASSASGARPSVFVADVPARGGRLCQSAVKLTREDAALQLLVGTFGPPGPPLVLTVRDPGSRGVVARGVVSRGWREGTLTVPLRFAPGAKTGSGLKLCVRSFGGTRLAFAGELDRSPATVNGRSTDGRIGVIALAGEQTSVADLLPAFRDRIGRGNADWIGGWTVWAISLLLVAGVALGGLAVAWTGAARAYGTVSDHLRIPAAGRALTAAALAVGLAWALLTPPFQVPDETSHVAYVQYLSESGELPVERPGVAPYSAEEQEILGALGFGRVIGRPLERVPVTEAEEKNLRRTEARAYPASGGNATTASANPPLYYALQAPAYLASSGGSLLTQLLVMRIVSVLFLTGSVLFAFLFVRELVPGSPWAWTAGGLACAFQPVLGFVGAGVNPDSLLFLCATALFFGCARVLRLGLTTRRAVLVAGALLAGLLTKPLFLALLPFAVAALALAVFRQRQGSLRPCAVAAAVVAAPFTMYVIVASAVLDHPYFAVAGAVASGPEAADDVATSPSTQASFMLQLFLPRLPFLADQIPGVPVRDIWLSGLVGVFGWVDYGFDGEDVVLGSRIFLVLLALSAVALVRHRRALRIQWPLLLCCLIGLAGVLGAVALTDYQAFITRSARFEQARYLLPLLALYGGLFALAAKALGARFGPLMLPVLWAAASLHTLAAMLLTINRYYL